MCAIFGLTVKRGTSSQLIKRTLSKLIEQSKVRGRDGVGFYVTYKPTDNEVLEIKLPQHQSYKNKGVNDNTIKEVSTLLSMLGGSLIGNCRAQPTTEVIEQLTNWDQQPYQCPSDFNLRDSNNAFHVVHNGTICNDAEILDQMQYSGRTPYMTAIDSGRIVDAYELSAGTTSRAFNMVEKLKGSFALLYLNSNGPKIGEPATNADRSIGYATNYKPIYYCNVNSGLCVVASTESILKETLYPEILPIIKIPPYTQGILSTNISNDIFITHQTMRSLNTKLTDTPKKEDKPKVMVILSGGLDSTVVAAKLKHDNFDVTLVHFKYGCNAESKEITAVENIAKELDLPLVVKDITGLWDPSSSTILNRKSKVAGSEAGAEYAHEWVPARNLVLASIAVAMAESLDVNYIALGNNLEESGAYPDNEPEFYYLLNKLLPYAVQAYKSVQFIQPVGDLMKSEIVKLGDEVNAPMHLTWSCYGDGKYHCGQCGPCFMRKTAHQVAGVKDKMEYMQTEFVWPDEVRGIPADSEEGHF